MPRPTIGEGKRGRGEVEVYEKAEVQAQDGGYHQGGKEGHRPAHRTDASLPQLRGLARKPAMTGAWARNDGRLGQLSVARTRALGETASWCFQKEKKVKMYGPQQTKG